MRIDADALPVLAAGFTEGAFFRFPEKLDRALYVKVDKALRAAGGKWNRVLKAHLLPGDAGEIVEAMLLTGQITSAKSEFGEFFTPPALAAWLAKQAAIEPGMALLEPSAGDGALAHAALAYWAVVTAVEIQARHWHTLEEMGLDLIGDDFLIASAILSDEFDRVLMNPPFAKLADARHVLLAEKHLAVGGRMVAVMSAAVTFRQERLYEEVRGLVARNGGTIEPLADGAFAASGTDVRTVAVIFDKRVA